MRSLEVAATLILEGVERLAVAIDDQEVDAL
jgi:hypothetical protein